jgi:hypothetical protein
MTKVYFITGAEGVGKTAIIDGLKRKFPKIKIYDFDEVGVPQNPPLQWRLNTTLYWIRVALKNQQRKKSTCILGLSFPSEIRSFEEFKNLENINFFLLDLSTREREND